jgi:magnesium-protoporphyrin IX monomethyl ester (oxidative) cyclase
VLKKGGGIWVVAGIESLHDEVLVLMDKGTKDWVNTQFLKWTRWLGILVSWNMLCGFPGEEDVWYGEMAEWLPLISHLEPPNDVRKIRFDRFSMYHMHPENYGLNLSPAWPYQYIYPLPKEELRRLVYFFETEGQAPIMLNPFRHIGRETSGLPSLGFPGRDFLQQRVHEWRNLFRCASPPILHMVEENGCTTIVDTRPVAVAERVVLEGLAHKVHGLCERASTLSAIVSALQNGGSEVDSAQVKHVLDDLIQRKLVMAFGDRYLALAVRGEMPPLPWKNEDGYPGGWFVYPDPPELPPRFEAYMSEYQGV